MNNCNINFVLIGADIIDIDGNILNRLGSFSICNQAKDLNILVFVASNILKYTDSHLKWDEIRNHDPKSIFDGNEDLKDLRFENLKFLNPYFDIVPQNKIDYILCEKGLIKSKNIKNYFHEYIRENYILQR